MGSISHRERAHNFLVDHLGYPAVKWPPRLVDQLEAVIASAVREALENRPNSESPT